MPRITRRWQDKVFNSSDVVNAQKTYYDSIARQYRESDEHVISEKSFEIIGNQLKLLAGSFKSQITALEIVRTLY